MVSLVRLLPFSLLSACGPTTTDSATGSPLHPSPPEIQEFEGSCSVQDGLWSFEVRTLGWTGNGHLYWAMNADYVEKHVLSSIEAASDGSSDRLSLELGIVADWRNAESNSSTSFQCRESTIDTLQMRLVVYDSSGATADCRSLGTDPEFFDAIESAPPCDLVWPGELALE